MNTLHRKMIFTVWFLNLSLVSYSQTWIVDNQSKRPTGSHILNDLPAAITAAAAGDTIYVKGSPDAYTNTTISKQVVIIGDGFKGTSSKVSTLTITMDASNTAVYGMDVTGLLSMNGSGTLSYLDNVTIAFNRIYRLTSSGLSTDSLRSATIRSNIIGSGYTGANYVLHLAMPSSNTTAENNVIYGSSNFSYGSVIASGVNLYRNVFIGYGGAQYSFHQVNNCTINNNLFYGRGAGAIDGTSAGNSFYSNMTFNTADDNLTNVIDSIGTDGGSNQFNVDPQFAALQDTSYWDVYNSTLEYAGASMAPGLSIGPDPNSFLQEGKWLPSATSVTGPVFVRQGSNLEMIIEASVDDGVHDVPTLQEAEYFFQQDQGFGLNTDTGLTLSGTTFSGSVTFSTSSLDVGNYTTYVRFRDNNRWGHYRSFDFQVYEPGDSISQITELEYFIDNDPGYGDGVAITVSPAGVDITETDAIPTDTLSLGFHTLYLRARDEYGNWGIPEGRLIYLDQSGTTAMVEAVECFFDADPGYGSGFALGTFGSANDITFPDSIQTDTLSLGFHTLFVRAQVGGGSWGIPEQRLIYVDASGAIANVDHIEYFFDIDPGYGNGDSLIAFTAASSVNVLDNITTESISLGFHTLFIRARWEGGIWGIPEQRLIYVDASGAIANVDHIEYFFDEDPGYGSGDALASFTEASSVNVIDNLATDDLSAGFHTLFIRARLEGGAWGIPEQRLIYLDLEGNVVANVAEFEYFFDNDPGYGLGISIPVTTPAPEVTRTLFLAASELPAGEHVVNVRTRDENDRWGIIESRSFFNLPPSRELDSVSLMVFYDETDGANWTNGNNWLTGQLDNWYGVVVTNGRVDSLLLGNNGLDGVISRQLGFLSELKYVDLAQNILKDTIPATLEDLNELVTLKLHDNAFNEIPDFSLIGTLSTVSLDSNFLDFGDLEPLAGIPSVTYSNQRLFNDSPIDTTVAIGQEMILAEEVGGLQNVYEWRQNGIPVPLADFSEYNMAAFAAGDSGVYRLHITNELITNLEIISEPYHLRISDLQEDSLAMVSFFNALNGTIWNNSSNWLSGPLSSWVGLTTQNNRVTQLSLPGNGLSGKLPGDMAYADALVSIDLSENAIRDTVPGSWKEFSSLVSADLSDNDIRSIPDFNNLNLLTSLNVSGNALQFGDLEKNVGITGLSYLDQDSISSYRDTLVDVNTTADLTFLVTGSNNSYQWFKGDDPVSGATTKVLTLENVQLEDEGNYRLQITNSLMTGLTLTSGIIEFGITSLKRDSTALRRLYETTGGGNWINKTNWTTGGIGTWQGVELNDNQTRVIGLSLPDNNLVNSIPVKIRDITSLESMDVSGNELSGMANLSVMQNLTDLDVSDNRLGFAEIQASLAIDNFTYSPQKRVGVQEEVKIPHGSDFDKSVSISGVNNLYQWKRNGGNVLNATAGTLHLDSITYETMGDYVVDVSNPNVPGLTISSERAHVLATADIVVTSFGKDNEQITSGTGYLLKVTQPGQPFDSTAVVSPVNSEFVFEDIVLADYLVALEASNTAVYLPTYYENTYLWAEADTLELRENTTEVIRMTVRPGMQTGDGLVYGTVEAEFAGESESGRIEARRKVKKAGCSMRRRTSGGGGRGQEDDVWELIAYIESNDEGQFEFENIPPGFYRFNIEYPGIPMDPDSFIEFEVGADGTEKNTFVLEALVTEEGIEVVKVKVLGFKRKYFKNLEVFPVPADDLLNITYEKLMSAAVEVQLVDMSGKIVYRENVRKGFEQAIRWDVSALKEGFYMVYFVDHQKGYSVSTWKLYISHQ